MLIERHESRTYFFIRYEWVLPIPAVYRFLSIVPHHKEEALGHNQDTAGARQWFIHRETPALAIQINSVPLPRRNAFRQGLALVAEDDHIAPLRFPEDPASYPPG